MKFTIYIVKNGYLLNIYQEKNTTSYIFKPEERMRMFALIDKYFGPEICTEGTTH